MKSKSLVFIFVCLAVSALAAIKIDSYDQAYAASHPAADKPVLMRVLGESRSIVSSASILQADRYFHGGLGHGGDDHCKAFSDVEEAYEEHDHHDHDHDYYVDEGVSPTNPFNILFNISREINVSEHHHLERDEVKEIMPWLYYATKIDDRNELAYVLSGYYLCDRLGKVDEGIAFLREGVKNNPESWKINAELGRVYFEHIENYAVAEEYFSKAWVLLQKTPHDKFEERNVLSYLAMSYKALGKEKEALPYYERLNELFPNVGYDKKIKELSV